MPVIAGNTRQMQQEAPTGTTDPTNDRVDERVAARQCQIAAENGRFGLLPLTLCGICYAGLLGKFIPPEVFSSWLLALGAMVLARVLVLAGHSRIDSIGRKRWLVFNALSLLGVGACLGVSTLWLTFPQETWVLAVVNLWLGGLACGALLGQGIVRWQGLAFAVPALAPLQVRLLASGDPTLLGLGIGNILFFAYLFHIIQRSQSYTIGEMRHPRRSRGDCRTARAGAGAERDAGREPVGRDRTTAQDTGRADRSAQQGARSVESRSADQPRQPPGLRPRAGAGVVEVAARAAAAVAGDL